MTNKATKKSLKGKGPTPRAEDRTYHLAHKKKVASERRKMADPKFARVRKAKAAASKFKRDSLEVIYGRNAVLEALRSNVPVSRLIFAAGIDHDERTKEMLQLVGEQGVALFESPRPELDAITKMGSHQGVVIQIPPFEYSSLSQLLNPASATVKLVVLDHITDPANLGAVVRSAAAFGFNIIIPERRSAEVNATVWKVSAGNLVKVKIAKVVNLSQTLEKLQKAGVFVVGLEGKASAALYDDQILDSSDIAFVAGAEGAGLSRLVSEKCDILAKIDTSVESLNVAMAATLAMYEFSKRGN